MKFGMFVREVSGKAYKIIVWHWKQCSNLFLERGSGYLYGYSRYLFYSGSTTFFAKVNTEMQTHS